MRSLSTRVAGPTIASLALRELRGREGYSQERLAAKAHVARAYVSRLERGLFSPTFRMLAKLLAAMGLSWTAFGEVVDRTIERFPASELKDSKRRRA